MSWRSMENAPRDGTWIQAEVPGHNSDFVIAFIPGYVGDNDEDVGAWTIMTEQEPPDDWTDGVCWALNEDNKPSTLPSRWKPLENQTRMT